ncbi:MAG: DUF924 domain-containing protein [Ectothiorhodospiraceae bacterium]|nr:DUF924 domain-containing protein [Ectothiorhodospiraceae bacterium]
MSMITPQKVTAFWFSEAVQPMWFAATPEFDGQLRMQYLDTYHAALKGELAHWVDTPEGALALIICLDQLPLNMFRGEAASFEGEQASRDVAIQAIDRGFDQNLNDQQKLFMYMPFMHSEDIADHDKVLTLFEQAGLTDNLYWARHHRDIVVRFGRFPHRNKILGRESSQEEQEYLASSEGFKG